MVLFLPYFGCSRHDAKVLGGYEKALPQVDEEWRFKMKDFNFQEWRHAICP